MAAGLSQGFSVHSIDLRKEPDPERTLVPHRRWPRNKVNSKDSSGWRAHPMGAKEGEWIEKMIDVAVLIEWGGGSQGISPGGSRCV